MYRFYLLLAILLNSLVSSAQLTWHYLPHAPVGIDRFEDVYFPNDTDGWAVSLNGTITQTHDGGSTWATHIVDSLHCRSVEFVSNNVGFIGTLNNHFLKTTDGGQNWNLLYPVSPDSNLWMGICGMSHVGMNNVYGVGAWNQPGHMIVSHDGGNHWEYKSIDSLAKRLVECNFLDSLTGFISGAANDSIQDAIILKTTDGGATWQKVFTSNVANEYCWKLQFLNDSLGFAAIQNVAGISAKTFIAKTTDGGYSWSKKLVFNTNINEEGMGFIDSLHGWVGGYFDGMFETTDGGDTWNFLNFGQLLNRLFLVRPGLMYAAGASIYKLSETPLSDETLLRPEYRPHRLLPCFPNPFSQSINIPFELDTRTFVKLDVFDMRGHLIENLISDWRSPGKHTTSFNCTNCSPGSYLVIMGTHERFLSEQIQYVVK